MIKTIELILSPQQAADKELQYSVAAQILSVAIQRITFLKLLKSSIDARSKEVKVRLLAEAYIDEPPPEKEDYSIHYHFNRDVSQSPSVLIIGCGPAGMFAALRLIELGIK